MQKQLRVLRGRCHTEQALCPAKELGSRSEKDLAEACSLSVQQAVVDVSGVEGRVWLGRKEEGVLC